MKSEEQKRHGIPKGCKGIWLNYSDLTRPHPKWWLSKGNPLISGKPRLVKYYCIWPERNANDWCLRLWENSDGP